MSNAMFAGSFDPIHLGHLAVIETAARVFDQLWVVAAGNPSKPSGLFSMGERTRLIDASTGHLANVHSISHGGLLVELAQRLEVSTLVRSLGRERANEFAMAHANASVSGVDTIFILPAHDSWSVSSSQVRARSLAGDLDAIEDLVPAPVAAVLRSRPAAQPAARPR